MDFRIVIIWVRTIRRTVVDIGSSSNMMRGKMTFKDCSDAESPTEIEVRHSCGKVPENPTKVVVGGRIVYIRLTVWRARKTTERQPLLSISGKAVGIQSLVVSGLLFQTYVISAGTYCQRDGDCNCPSYETGYCGVPIQSGLIHGGHIGHRCHCLALLSHCPGACSSLACGSHTILGHTIHTDKACVDKHCLCLMRPQVMRIPNPLCLTVILLQICPASYASWSFLHSLLTSDWGSGSAHSDLANPCCSFPCENRGVCMTEGFGRYSCDCTGTGYYGDRCQTPTFWKKVELLLRPRSDTLHALLTEDQYTWLWSIVNFVPFLRDYVMKSVYVMRGAVVDSPATLTSEHEYITLEAYGNWSYFSRALPPVPRDCPTPHGIWGKKELPDAQLVVEKLMLRKTFTPERLGTNALFTFFAQHFTHQFFKTDFKRGPGFQWGGHGVDVSHVYGHNKAVELTLRSFADGKLKMQVLNGETWPLHLKDAQVPMTYPPSVPEELRFALGHKDFGLLPGLFMYATIWMREHNRVCDVLKGEHPEWDDERLFQTAKLIIMGETIKIVIEDYVQHLSNYHYKLMFKPELLFNTRHQYSNRISVEFNHMYHWHPLMPDTFNISGTVYTVKDFLFRPDLVIMHGMRDFVAGLINQRAGAFKPRNHHPLTLNVAKETILHGRELRFQSFNQYRKRFGLAPYKSFLELAGDEEIAKDLEELYDDIDSVEFYAGIVTEKTRSKAIFGSTVIELGGPFSVTGLMSAPICSPKYWKPSTFGGDIGFDIIKTATLEKLFCQNIDSDCPKIGFKVPFPLENDLHEEL